MRQPRSLLISSRSNQMSTCPQQHTTHLMAPQTRHAPSSKSRNHRTTNNVIRASEYRSLRQVVPSLRRQRDLGKVAVVTEAAKYIDHLHKTLIKRFVACGIPESMKDVLGTDNANELNSQHIMNLVTQMAAKQRAGQRVQQQSSAIISSIRPSQQQQQHQLASLQLSSAPAAAPAAAAATPIQITTSQTQRKSLPLPVNKRCLDELSCFGRR